MKQAQERSVKTKSSSMTLSNNSPPWTLKTSNLVIQTIIYFRFFLTAPWNSKVCFQNQTHRKLVLLQNGSNSQEFRFPFPSLIFLSSFCNWQFLLQVPVLLIFLYSEKPSQKIHGQVQVKLYSFLWGFLFSHEFDGKEMAQYSLSLD